jgi:hypothetical protein
VNDQPFETPNLVARCGFSVALAAVRRACRDVTLRYQHVFARYSLGEDKLKHIAVGDPDPGPSHGCQACGFEWADQISTGLVLLWRCTRLQGHHGQHLAGTGERVAAVHPHSAHGHPHAHGDLRASNG